MRALFNIAKISKILELAAEMDVVIRGYVTHGDPMTKSLHAAFRPSIMAIFAVGALAIAAGVVGVAQVRAEPQSRLVFAPVPHAAPSMVLKGGACSLLEWPNYEPSCQFDARPPAAAMRNVRIIAVR